ncbi:DUF3488 and transglutaminase-like domain-containing protein [Alkalilimnicola ehrlichii]|nr:DUF3488 and transglutaminase-like domain-containing protein [Alkalilimnicola ehrlichii]
MPRMTRNQAMALPQPLLLALLLTLAAILLPHALRLPAWITAAALGLGLWGYYLNRSGRRLPAGWLRGALTVGIGTGIVIHHGTFIGLQAGTALLVVMTALKLLELRRRRDLLVVLYLGYFLILTQFFHSQSIPSALYLLAAVWAMTAILIAVQQAPATATAQPQFRLAAGLLAQALPIMVVLFILFPRLPGPLWALPDDAHSGITGLSETMTPGAISELTRSDAVAFRVEFDGALPRRDQLYWRGPVLTAYDGYTWRRDSAAETPLPIYDIGTDTAIDYTIVLQPHTHNWLISLDRPITAPSRSRLNRELELVTASPVYDSRRYSLSSRASNTLPAALPPDQRQRYLQLPPDRHPKAQAQAQEWVAADKSEEEILEAAVRFFSTRPFTYTMNPPRMQRDAVDEFLFETQRGFCEHYASAFVVLLRAAGVPARVVTGYMGGEFNNVGDYMIVRQSDAHAWAEVWLPERGWLRADPTGLVAPQRIELGLGGAVADTEPVPRMARGDNSWGRQLRLYWDAVNQRWDYWVLGYGPELQQQVLARLGLVDSKRMATALIVAVATLLCLLSLFLLWETRRAPPDEASALFQRFCRKLARQGIVRQPHETATGFARRVADECPELAAKAELIATLYTRLRYEPTPREQWLQRLREAVATVPPR